MIIRLPVLLLLIVVGCSSPSPQPLSPASPDSLRKTVEYLASDELEGRGVGTAGIDSAASYIAHYFRGLGLNPPPGQSSFFQTFTFTTISGPDESTSLSANGTTLNRGEDYQPLSMTGEGTFSAPVVFVGYGITARKDKDGNDINYDDFANLDLTGNVALMLRYEPVDKEGKSRLSKEGFSSPHADLRTKARLAREKGAVAVLIVHPPIHPEPESLSPFSVGSTPTSIPIIQIRQSIADRFLSASVAPDLKTIQQSIIDSFSPRHFPLRGATLSGAVHLKRDNHQLKNITALLPGRGRYADEYIVVGAHYDHLGKGGPGSMALPQFRTAIHHGADDNASGTAAIMEVARLLKAAGPLPRSVLFVAFTGEERGLLGSKHWVNNPPVPLEKIVAMLNLDMVGRVRDNIMIVGGAGTSARFPSIIKAADDASPLVLEDNPQWHSGRAPSDIISFIDRQIPSIMLWSKNHPDYHKPTDTADKINYEGLAQSVDVTVRLVTDLASARELAFTAPTTTQPATSPSMAPGTPTLGIMPDYTATVKGLRIESPSPGGPADQAGLKPGDVIVKFNDLPITGIEDYMTALSSAQANQPTKVEVLRNGQTMTLDVTPTIRSAPR